MTGSDKERIRQYLEGVIAVHHEGLPPHGTELDDIDTIRLMVDRSARLAKVAEQALDILGAVYGNEE